MQGVIAAGDQITAEVGAKILAQGGNAVDAAVGAAFASFMSEIGVVHLGGSGIAQIYDPHTATSKVYDFFSSMPGLGYSGDIDTNQLDFHKVVVDFGATTQDFYVGRGAVAVPGNIFGLCQMAAEHGRLPLSDVLAPAIELARNGLNLCAFQAFTCQLLNQLYTHTPEMRQIFLHEGHILQEGDRLFIPHLAETLEAIAQHGAAYARSGPLANALLDDQKAYGGLLTADDLQAYEVKQHQPILIPYREYEILLPRPCSTGGVLTAFTLKLLSTFNVGHWEHGSAEHVQLLIEAMSATTRARRHWEQALANMPIDKAVERFLNDEFVKNFAAETAMSLWKGRPNKFVDEVQGKPNTSHMSVIDGQGMAVSLTTTAGESAGYVVPGTGYIPNNMLGEEDLHPNGFHTGTPGERINTMMTPVVVLKNGRIKLVVGSGGSIRIRSAILQVISNALDFGWPLDKAVEAPRVHVEKQIVQCEHGYNPAAVDEIEAIGYQVNRWQERSMYFGGAHSVGFLEDGTPIGAGDTRRNGFVAYG